jgi:hypothetical protein
MIITANVFGSSFIFTLMMEAIGSAEVSVLVRETGCNMPQDSILHMAYSGALRRVDLVRTDVSEELSASFIRVTRIGVLATTLDITSNRRTVFLRSVRRLLVTASVVPSSPILVTLRRRHYVPPKRRFLQEPHSVTPHKTTFFIVTAVFWDIKTQFVPHRRHVSATETSRLILCKI